MKTLGSGEQMAEEEDTEERKQQSFIVAVFINYFPIHHFLICYFACLGMLAAGLGGLVQESFGGERFYFTFSEYHTNLSGFDGFRFGFIFGGFVSTMLLNIFSFYNWERASKRSLLGENWDILWPIYGVWVGAIVLSSIMVFLFIPFWLLALILKSLFAVDLWTGLAITDEMSFYEALAIGPFIFAFVAPMIFEAGRRFDEAYSAK